MADAKPALGLYRFGGEGEGLSDGHRLSFRSRSVTTSPSVTIHGRCAGAFVRADLILESGYANSSVGESRIPLLGGIRRRESAYGEARSTCGSAYKCADGIKE